MLLLREEEAFNAELTGTLRPQIQYSVPKLDWSDEGGIAGGEWTKRGEMNWEGLLPFQWAGFEQGGGGHGLWSLGVLG